VHENSPNNFMLSRVAESEVKYPTLTFQNFQLRLLNIKGMKFSNQ